MSYQILIQRSALRTLEKIPTDVRNRIYQALRDLSRDPRPPGCKKLRDSDYWRIRISDYRAIYEINDTAHTVVILRIAHRGEVYR